jgi:hypothetical protein
LGSIPGGITGGMVAAHLSPIWSSIFATALLLGTSRSDTKERSQCSLLSVGRLVDICIL